MGGRSPDSWVVDTWPCLFLVSAASHLLSKTCSVDKWAAIDVNVTYLLDVTSIPRSHVTISICTIQNPPCWMKLLPENPADKTHPAQRACSPSNELTKPSLLNKPASSASSLKNPPFLTSLLPEEWAYKTLPAQWACSLNIELTIPSLLKKRGFCRLDSQVTVSFSREGFVSCRCLSWHVIWVLRSHLKDKW